MLLGLLLAVAAMPVSHENRENTSSVLVKETEYAAEKSELETKLESLLSNVEGVGKIQVMLMTGVSQNTGDFYNSKEVEITGVLIAAQGADDPVTVQNIQQAVMALFQIEAHKIKIMKMK